MLYDANNQHKGNDSPGKEKTSEMIRFNFVNSGTPLRPNESNIYDDGFNTWGKIVDVRLPNLSDMIVFLNLDISWSENRRSVIKLLKTLLKEIYTPHNNLLLERLDDQKRIECMNAILRSKGFFARADHFLDYHGDEDDELLETGIKEDSDLVVRYDLNYFPKSNGNNLTEAKEERVEIKSQISSTSGINPDIILFLHPRVTRYVLEILMEKFLLSWLSDETRTELVKELSQAHKVKLLGRILMYGGFDLANFAEVIDERFRSELPISFRIVRYFS